MDAAFLFVWRCMATIVDTYTKDGDTINVYESGAHYNATRGHLVKAPPSAVITSDRARELHKIRAAKTARLLREKIVAATGKISDLPIRTASEAVAEVGGILWEEIVLNPDAYPRDRMEAFDKLTERAEMSNQSKRQNDEKNNTPADFMNAAAELLREMRQAIQPREVIDGKVTGDNDTRSE
jgi:hypothetical protein